MRIRYIVIPVIVIVVVALAVFAFLAANVNRYRPRVQAELQKKLDRQVTIGHLGLRLFPLALRADDVTIAEAPNFGSSRPFATAKELYVSVGFFSLITGNPEVKDLILDQPQIELIHSAAGVWNFSTLGGNTQTGSSNSNSSISLNELKINDGTVGVTDIAANEPRSVYNHIDLKVTDFAPGKKFGVDADVHFPGSGKELLGFKGKVGPLQPGNSSATPLDGHLSLQEVSLAAVNKFASGALPPNTDSTASGDADISSQGPVLSAKGDLKLQNTTLRGSKLDFPINAAYNVTANRAQDTIDVKSGKLDLGSTSFNMSGTVNDHPKPAVVDVHLTTSKSSITELAKLAGSLGIAFNPAYQIKGLVTADITAKGPTTAPQLNGTLSATQLEASGGEIKTPVSVPEISLALTPDSIKSNTFTASSGATAVTGNFTLTHYTAPTRDIDATMRTEGANIAELLNMAKAYGVDASNGASGTGKLSANIHVQGPLSNSSGLDYSGTASVAGATLNTPALTKPVSIASANAQFSKNSIAISNLAASLGATNLHGTLSAKNFAAPDVQFNLAADKIDTAELQALAAPTKTPTAKTPASTKPSLLDTTTGSGTLAVTTVKAEDIVLSNFHSNVKLNRGVITLSPVNTDIFNGKETGTLTLDTRPANPLCAVNAKFSGVDTNALLSAVSSAKNTLYGSLAANTNLHFTLVSSNDLAKTLNGTVAFDVTNGQLKNVNILNELSKVGKFLGKAPAQSGNSTALQKFSGTMNIVNGVASTDNLAAAINGGSLAAKGTINLANQGLDLHMSAALSSGVSQDVGGTHVGGFLNTALSNSKGELVLPVIVTGTMDHPIFAPDAEGLAKMKLNNLLPTVSNPAKLGSALLGGKGASGIVNGLLGGKAPAAGQKSNAQTPQDSINSILNSFGKKKKKPQ